MPVPREHLQPTLGALYDYIDTLEQRIAQLEGGESVAKGTAAQLNTGTDEVGRTWDAKTLHDYIEIQVS